MITIKVHTRVLLEPKIKEALNTLIQTLALYGGRTNANDHYSVIFTNAQGSHISVKRSQLLEHDLGALLQSSRHTEGEHRQSASHSASDKRAQSHLSAGDSKKGSKAQKSGSKAQKSGSKPSSTSSKSKKARKTKPQTKPTYQLHWGEFDAWLNTLSPEIKRFVTTLQREQTLSAESAYELLNIPQEERQLKRLNGKLGSVARWKSPQPNHTLLVPWQSIESIYHWRGELILKAP